MTGPYVEIRRRESLEAGRYAHEFADQLPGLTGYLARCGLAFPLAGFVPRLVFNPGTLRICPRCSRRAGR